jgi:hypothetical protein
MEQLYPRCYSNLKILTLEGETSMDANGDNVLSMQQQRGNKLAQIWWRALVMANYKQPSRAILQKAISELSGSASKKRRTNTPSPSSNTLATLDSSSTTSLRQSVDDITNNNNNDDLASRPQKRPRHLTEAAAAAGIAEQPRAPEPPLNNDVYSTTASPSTASETLEEILLATRETTTTTTPAVRTLSPSPSPDRTSSALSSNIFSPLASPATHGMHDDCLPFVALDSMRAATIESLKAIRWALEVIRDQQHSSLFYDSSMADAFRLTMCRLLMSQGQSTEFVQELVKNLDQVDKLKEMLESS